MENRQFKSVHSRPMLTSTDILRIIKREYLKHEVEVRGMLDRIQAPERARVHAAILKLGEGDLMKFRTYAHMAMQDPDSILSFAEFPNFFHIDNNTPEKIEQSINRDLLAYIRWVRR